MLNCTRKHCKWKWNIDMTIRNLLQLSLKGKGFSQHALMILTDLMNDC